MLHSEFSTLAKQHTRMNSLPQQALHDTEYGREPFPINNIYVLLVSICQTHPPPPSLTQNSTRYAHCSTQKLISILFFIL